MNDTLKEAGGSGHYINAEGLTSGAVWGKTSPWVAIRGTVKDKDGEKPVTVAMYADPKGLNAPPYWHARDYGLFAANAFDDHDFLNDKTKDGSITLQPGKSMRFRYRVVIHPGDTAAAHINDLYRAWKP